MAIVANFYRLIWCLLLCVLLPAINVSAGSISPNRFKGSDTERIQQAVDEAARLRKKVYIGYNAERDRGLWVIDKAVLLPSDASIVIDGCTLKLSDSCRDNMFRSNNVGIGIVHPEWNRNIRIVGRNGAVLSGADNPRATGDGLRNLSLRPGPYYNSPGRTSYGSDAGKKGVKQKSDWRNFLVLMGYVDGFTLKGVRIEHAHCWAVTCERVHHGNISHVSFFTPDFRVVDGQYVGKYNCDGIDLREGCKHFRIEYISGINGDDLIALSALDLGKRFHNNGDVNSYQVTSTLHDSHEADIEHVTIRNCQTNFMGVAVRASDSVQIHHVRIKNICTHAASLLPPPEGGTIYTILVGNDGYGKAGTKGNIHHMRAENICGDGKSLIKINGSVADCVFKNAVYKGKEAAGPISYVHAREKSANVKEVNLRKVVSDTDYPFVVLPVRYRKETVVCGFAASVEAAGGSVRMMDYKAFPTTGALYVDIALCNPPAGYSYGIRQKGFNHIEISAADMNGIGLGLEHLRRSIRVSKAGISLSDCGTPLVPRYDKNFNIINKDMNKNIYTFSVPDKKGNVVSLAQFNGKVLLVVNTASRCGFTPQYEELEAMYERLHDKGLEILDIPCNQFGQQAPGTDEEITQFCQLNYGTKFPQFKKSDVNGDNALPLYNWLKSELGFKGFNQEHPIGKILQEMLSKADPDFEKKSDIKWNFTKFLIDREGKAVRRFEPTDDLKEVEEEIKKLL